MLLKIKVSITNLICSLATSISLQSKVMDHTCPNRLPEDVEPRSCTGTIVLRLARGG